MLRARHAVVVGLDHGDEGKGKVVAALAKMKSLNGKNKHFDYCVRFNGGPNAGHTIYLENGNKAVTHIIPTGVLFGLEGIIGKGCVLNVKGFFEELVSLEEALGHDIRHRIKIDPMVHIISKDHMYQDARTDKIGSTKRGIAPVYADKMLRNGTLARDVPELKSFIEAFEFDEGANYLFEGAQGFYLDPDHGDYPYVTSSGCLPHNIHNTGFPYGEKVHVVGVCKAYSTYVGTKNFGYDGEDTKIKDGLIKCQEIGQEFGATTGRKRKIDILDFYRITHAASVCGVDTLIVNKVDILREAKAFHLKFLISEINNEHIHSYHSLREFERAFQVEFAAHCDKPNVDILFSGSPLEI